MKDGVAMVCTDRNGKAVKTLMQGGTVIVSTEQKAQRVLREAGTYNVIAGYKKWRKWYAVFVKKRLG